MKIVRVSAIPMSAPVPEEKRHRTDLGTKVRSDATLIRVEADNGLTGIGAALDDDPHPLGELEFTRFDFRDRAGLQELRRETLGAGGLRSELIENHGQPSSRLARAV